MIQLPPSKSIGARYLTCTYFAGTLPADPIFNSSEDLLLLQQALLEIFSDEEPIDYGDSPLDVGESGTALRFVTAVCASCQGADYVVTGTPRLMHRPMLPLLDLLKEAGAGVSCLGKDQTGPYRVTGAKLKGGSFKIRGDVSSQFISAVMLVAPAWQDGVVLSFSTPLVSRPYVEMTAKIMEIFSIKVNLSEEEVSVSPGRYLEPLHFLVEPDWSAASFFYEASAIGGLEIELEHLVSPSISLQGDAIADELFKKLGVVSSFSNKSCNIKKEGQTDEKVEIDFYACPDLMLPLAVACLCNGVKFRFTGLSTLRLKESDRINSLKLEALKLGYVVETGDDFLQWDGETCGKELIPEIDPHGDHRVAMAFAMTALKFGEVHICHPEVVAKSFMNFWSTLPALGLSAEEIDGKMIVRK